MAEVKWQARRISDGVLVDVTGDTEGTPAGAPTPNVLEGGAVEQTVLSRTVTLTDAQIKALPGTDIEIVPAVSAGQIIAVVGGLIYCDTTAAIYTNIDATARVEIQYTSGGAGPALTQIDNFNLGVTDMLAAGGIVTYSLGPKANVIGGETFGFAGQDVEGDGLELAASNGAAGNFTGGNAANFMKVTVFYVVVDL